MTAFLHLHYDPNFLFLCVSCNFLLRNGHFKYYNVADLEILLPLFRDVAFVVITAAVHSVTFLNKFYKVFLLHVTMKPVFSKLSCQLMIGQ